MWNLTNEYSGCWAKGAGPCRWKKTVRALDRYIRKRDIHKDSELPYLWLGIKVRIRESGIRQAIRRRGADAGFGRVYPRQLRHSFAHSWLSESGTESDLMRLAGWNSRTMLSRYVAIAATEQAVAASQRQPWRQIVMPTRPQLFTNLISICLCNSTDKAWVFRKCLIEINRR